jgi:CBS domain-containing protein/Flp pilus assembly pilin Flp
MKRYSIKVKGSYGLLACTRASAMVEYSVILGIIGILVIGGGMAVRSAMFNATHNLAAAMPNDGRATAGLDAGASASHALVAGDAAMQPVEGDSRLWAWLALGAAGTGLAGMGYWLGKRRKPQPGEPGEIVSLTETCELDLQKRIFAKRQDVLRVLANDPSLMTTNQITVRHLMTPRPLVVSPETDIDKLRELMLDNRIHHLLVCEKTDQLVGVLSDRDLHQRPGKTARALMTPNPCTVSSDTPLSVAISCLINRRISCLPVADNGRVEGVITTVDMVVMSQCVLQLWLQLAHDTQFGGASVEQLVTA